MPWVIQIITHVVPARYFILALRAILLKGASLTSFWPDLAALGVFAIFMLGLASVRLRREWA
jgi:ABC-2 type transport system permease protein